MNKQLINKYKPEFDHWLNGGKLLCYTEVDGPYYEVTDEKWDFVCDIGFIINDEYSEFRKALTEGKIIQIYDVIEQHISNPSLDKFGWKDFKSLTASSSFSKTPDFYRIKPDEPKFKVGDFVRYIHADSAVALEINNINGARYNFINSEMSCLEHELEPWTPVKGEWCWFYDKASNKYSHLAKFNGMWKNKFRSTTDTPWQFCEPFLNSLPSYLKDK